MSIANTTPSRGARERRTRMKLLYCWRCRTDVPMLDESEFAVVAHVHRQCTAAVKAYREQHGATLANTPRADLMRPVLETYRELTGVNAGDPDHVLKHRLALIGPPCTACGRPLRTPQASFCAACGHAA